MLLAVLQRISPARTAASSRSTIVSMCSRVMSRIGR
jgi:hypothetical protein